MKKTTTMKKLLVLFLLVISIPAISQYEECVYLKNGSVVTGRLLEVKPNEYIKFRTDDGNFWVFNMADIAKLEVSNSPYNKPDTLKKSYLLCDIGFLAGTVENELKAPLSFMARMNFQVYKALYLGIGTGLEFYQMTYVPVFAEIRLQPSFSRVSFFLHGGPTFPFDSKGKLNNYEYSFKTGYFFNPGISYSFAYKSGAAFTMSIGYRYQETDAKRIDEGGNIYMPQTDYTVITRLNRFSIRLGYSFK